MPKMMMRLFEKQAEEFALKWKPIQQVSDSDDADDDHHPHSFHHLYSENLLESSCLQMSIRMKETGMEVEGED